jgi:hypothetical protein
MKATLLPIFLLICTSIYAFEIKPMGLSSYKGLMELDYSNRPSSTCEKTRYKVIDAKPVHEKITLDALKEVCDRYRPSINKGIFYNKCSQFKYGTVKNISSNDALLSGVQFNDDPTRILSRDNKSFIDDVAKAKNFEDISHIPYSLTNRSHYGDLQFLHAMKSTENELPKETIGISD